MNKDFSNYKFRCSSLGKLMTKSKDSITSKQLEEIAKLESKACLTDIQSLKLRELLDKKYKSNGLSATAKSYLADLWIEEIYGRKKENSSKYTEKGLYCEEDGLALAGEHFNKILIKNKERFNNIYIEGTPDAITNFSYPDKEEPVKTVIDIKCSWDIWTFIDADLKNDYYWQGIGYMNLVKSEDYKLIYCLCNSPEHLVSSEKSKMLYIKGYETESPEWADLEYQIDKNMNFDDLPNSKRIKIIEFKNSKEDYKKLIDKIKQAREFLNELNLL